MRIIKEVPAVPGAAPLPPGSAEPIIRLTDVHKVYGSGDVEQRLPAMFLPSRWPLAKRSHWNRALADGRVQRVFLGDMIHTGPKGYLDPDCHVPDGRSFLDVTAAPRPRAICTA